MINTSINTKSYDKSQGDVRTSIEYINDLHGRLKGAHKYKIIADSFYANTKNKDVDPLLVTNGDMYIGPDTNKNNFITCVLNLIKPTIATLGNHSLDLKSNPLAKVIDKINFKYVVTNLNYEEGSPFLEDIKAKRLVKSAIIEKNGHKYGYVGALAPDAKNRTNGGSSFKHTDIDSMEQTIKDLQEEVNKLEKQGVNKIIMLSHLGDDRDIQVAQKVSGIDIITGAHTHKVLQGIKPGKNYLKGPDGSPVIITQAGRDGRYYGILDVVFDKDGKIKAANNNVLSTKPIPKSLVTKFFEEKYLGKAMEIGNLVNTVEAGIEEVLEESAIAQFTADAIRAKSGADIAMFNKAGVKGELEKGIITDRDITECTPYKNKLFTYKFSEKDVIDALQGGINSYFYGKKRPNILQCSGLKYTVGKDKKVKDIFIENKDGNYTKIDHLNPNKNKFYTVTYNEYINQGLENVEMLKCPEKLIKAHDYTDTEAVIEHIKSFNNKPIEIKQPGRIIIE